MRPESVFFKQAILAILRTNQNLEPDHALFFPDSRPDSLGRCPVASRLPSFFKIMFKVLLIFRERGREGERGKETPNVWATTCMPLTGDPACNPGMCPGWESNQRHFGSQASTQSTEPHQPGQQAIFCTCEYQGRSCSPWFPMSFVAELRQIKLEPPPQLLPTNDRPILGCTAGWHLLSPDSPLEIGSSRRPQGISLCAQALVRRSQPFVVISHALAVWQSRPGRAFSCNDNGAEVRGD